MAVESRVAFASPRLDALPVHVPPAVDEQPCRAEQETPTVTLPPPDAPSKQSRGHGGMDPSQRSLKPPAKFANAVSDRVPACQKVLCP